jgi:hypothetical protein
MKRIGIEPGKSFDISKVDPVVRKALEDAPAAGQQLMAWKVPTIARVVNYWSMNTDTMGVYGTIISNAPSPRSWALVRTKMRSTHSTSPTKPASRSTAQASTRFTSTRARRDEQADWSPLDREVVVPSRRATDTFRTLAH